MSKSFFDSVKASSLVDKLNNKIRRSSSDIVYSSSSGSGLFARNMIDGIQDNPYAVINTSTLPSTFLHNDIEVPTQFYPSAATDLLKPQTYSWGGPWGVPVLMGVSTRVNAAFTNQIAKDADYTMSKKGRTDKEESDWFGGVFYAHDSNASDERIVPFWDDEVYNRMIKQINNDGGNAYMIPGTDWSTIVDKDPKNIFQNPELMRSPASTFTSKLIGGGTTDPAIAEDSYRPKDFAGRWNIDVLNTDNSWQNGSGNTWLTPGNPGDSKNIADAAKNPTIRYGAGSGIHADQSHGYYVNFPVPSDIQYNKFNYTAPRFSDLWDFVTNEEQPGPSQFYTKYPLGGPKNDTGLYGAGLTGWFGEMNYNLKGDNNDWNELINYFIEVINSYAGAQLETGDIDELIPWVNNPKQLIQIQNALWSRKKDIGGNDSAKEWWGWNEVPLGRDFWVDDIISSSGTTTPNRANLEAFYLALPTNVYTESLTGTKTPWNLVKTGVASQINAYIDLGYLKNKDRIVFAETTKDPTDDKKYQIKFKLPGASFRVDKNSKITKDGVLETTRSNGSNQSTLQFDKFSSDTLSEESSDLGKQYYSLVNSPVGYDYKINLSASAFAKTEASFENIIGLYQMENTDGGVVDSLDVDGDGLIDDLINPGDKNYFEAAYNNLIKGSVVTVGGTSNPENSLPSASNIKDIGLYAPFILANSGVLKGSDYSEKFSDFTKQNPGNSAATKNNFKSKSVGYTSFRESNPDGMNHVKNYGGNLYGFEDLPGNIGVSDLDFNDAMYSYQFNEIYLIGT
jgi:hypothetical protein